MGKHEETIREISVLSYWLALPQFSTHVHDLPTVSLTQSTACLSHPSRACLGSLRLRYRGDDVTPVLPQ